jgi:hypothetical protein
MQIPPTPLTITILTTTPTPEPPLAPGETFKVVFNHTILWYTFATDGVTVIPCPPFYPSQPPPNCFNDTSNYNLLIDGAVKQSLSASVNTGGIVTFTVTGGLQAGSYSIIVQAVGSGGTTGSTALTLPVVQR